jgi:hypothetical protein
MKFINQKIKKRRTQTLRKIVKYGILPDVSQEVGLFKLQSAFENQNQKQGKGRIGEINNVRRKFLSSH